MLATGKQILIKNGNVEVIYEIVPVLRNGKPTKRTKEIQTIKYSDALADSYLIDGHEVYMIRKDVEEAKIAGNYNRVIMFKEDSSMIYADCKFGRTGTVNHKVLVKYNVSTDRIEIQSTGYNGADGKGHGAYVVRINW